MGFLKTPKLPEPEKLPEAPSVSDEESRRASEIERKRRSKKGGASTVLAGAPSRKLGIANTSGALKAPATRVTVLGGA
ncbi:MAG: hypothetical protein COA69_13450 [Robiginitomaculum sp.]|nr:MAG: hypothetical protein COA69_13450 [Robiginitomaculum sp.]